MYIKRIARAPKADEKIFLNAATAVALGNFDGLHKGHLALIKSIIDYAKMNDVKSCVFSFTSNVNGSPYITSKKQREELLRSLNVDCFIMHDFTHCFKSLEPHVFFEKYIIDFLAADYVVAGYNYRFGRNAEGDADLLKKLCIQHNIYVDIIPPVLYRGKPVSSTRIRGDIEAGRLDVAKAMLGREFSVLGKVIDGDKIGNKLGFPTANLNVDENHVMPPKGVYATTTYIDGKSFSSVTNFGGKPTIKKSNDLIETHILEFDGDLYGKDIEVSFLKKIRNITAYTSKLELCKQLENDKITRKQIGREK
ncbi:MAG: bifunctional riboflavin kinase/FAD synthetase [Firmicutes bacterium]|nr:bifunctional riboflavin kinase/FAD synthetase [Bacillota bacterium]